MITLTDFKNSLAQIVRPNRFLVTINPPSVYNHEKNLKNLKFFVQGAKIPEKNIGSVEMKYHGMSVYLPGDQTHEDLSLTILNHYDWEPRDFFENWITLLHDTRNHTGLNYRYDGVKAIYDAFLLVEQLGDRESDVLAIYKFWNAFPKSVSESELSMSEFDSAQTFQVTFAYSHWEQLDVK